MERIKSGIVGLDELLQGGFPKGSAVLVSGGSGTGKTIFSMQYIYAGARQFGQPGIFVTVESSQKTIEWDMISFNWGIHELQEKKLMSIYRMNLGYAKNG
ncbi:MAG: ATPase domain-containing protein, partial [Candidatus Diapherotrites archaeon]|nr:ATPase domain-containing protein [Candidatus Diapherotrites archaeon]